MDELKTIDTTVIRGGYLVPADDSHLGAWQIEEQRLDHDNFLPPLVCSYLEEGDVVIDCGAFNGDHTIAYSNKVGAKGMVIAVEAGALAVNCLRHNAGLFKNKNVLVIHAAIGEVCGDSVSHKAHKNLGASVCNEVKKEDLIKGEKYLQTVTIDYLVEQCKRKVNFIKMDIEGWEVKALIGGSKTLRDMRPGLLVEVNDGALLKHEETCEDILDVLRHHKYSWKIAQPECNMGDAQYDLLCFPEEKNIFGHETLSGTP